MRTIRSIKDLGITLFEHQEYSKEFIKSHKKCHLYLDMGAGKTLATLSALYEMDLKTDTLIVAPINIAKTTWIEESEKWNFGFKFKSFILNENEKKISKKKRLELYEYAMEKERKRRNGEYVEPEIFLINNELLADIIAHCYKMWPFDNIIIDEVQSFKSHSSKRFKAMKVILDQTSVLVGLTGTPTPKGLEDLWSQIYLIDKGERLEKNITTFRDYYFRPGRIINNVTVDYIPLPFAEDVIYKKINDCVISIKNPNLNLPEIIYNYITISLDEKEKKLYKKFKKEYIIDIEGETIEAKNAAVLTCKLLQMSSGAIYIDNVMEEDSKSKKEKEYLQIHTKKLEMLKYIIDNTPTPVIVAYFFKSDKDMITKYLKKNKIKSVIYDGKPSTKKKWNDGQIPVMLINPMSAGHGLNFQYGGHTLVWYTIPWSLEGYLQTNKRLHRPGQTNTVTIHHLIIKNTIDEKVVKALKDKKLTMDRLLEAVAVSLKDDDL